jgi:hypothetical protein
VPVTGRKHTSEVRFSVEARQATSEQAEAGEKFFGKLTTKACASLTARSAATEGSEAPEKQDVGGEQRWPSS